MPRRLLASVALALLALSVSVPPAAATPRASIDGRPELSRYAGRYRFGGAAPEQRAFESAVEAALASLDPLTRTIARPMLLDRNRPYGSVEIRVEGDHLRFRLGSWGPFESAVAARTVTDPRGDRIAVSHRASDDRLVQRLRHELGQRENHFWLSPDGGTLVLDAIVTAPRLPRPITFRLTYARVS